MPTKSRFLALATIFLASVAPATWAQEAAPAGPRYREAAVLLERLIDHEREAKGLPAVSIALVADGRVVWARGFGMADPAKGIAATADTVYRVGSVSKLFTDLALMQLVEEGKVDLDAPVKTYLPTFDVKNPTATPITLRQLMSHRSGLTREPPLGHYFDPDAPSQADTVASLNRTEVVYPPTTRTKYSNAAVAVVGEVVAAIRGEPFEAVVRRDVIDRMGMGSSDFRLRPDLAKGLAKGRMWTYDGRTFDAPTFPLGTSAAGNLYSTANDLGKFLVLLTSEGDAPGGRVVRPETLEAMRRIQFAEPGQRGGFGLGFVVGRFEGHPLIGHGGAVYGFATEVAALPEERIGVAVVASKDCANGAARRIGEEALRMLLAVEEGKPLPTPKLTAPVDPNFARRLDARPRSPFALRFGKLYLTGGSTPPGGSDDELRGLDGAIVRDGPLRVAFDQPFPFDQPLEDAGAAPDAPPPDAPEALLGLIGEYGWDHDVLYVYESGGRPWILIEWFFSYPLEGEGPDKFRLGDVGMYNGERAEFRRDASGRATVVLIGDVVFQRRAIPGEDGKTFRVRPLRPVTDLRAEALAASPPKEVGEFLASDLVDLAGLDPTIKLDVRYATDDNFLGAPFYSSARAFLQRPAAEALAKAHRSLAGDGLGLMIHDAYRPWHVTKMFWDAVEGKDRGFVADPSKGSRHNRGCAVDLTLYDLKKGEPLRMAGGYDEFSDRSNPHYPGGTARQRWGRDKLRRAMEGAGFAVNEVEWWHFDFRDWARYPIGNATFEELARP